MALDTPYIRTTHGRLMSCKNHELSVRENVNIAPSLVIPFGTCLGLVAASANDVATLTVSGTPTSGSLTIGFTIDGVTSNVVVAMAATVFPSNAAIQALVRALPIMGPGTVTITGTLGGAANGTVIATYTGFFGLRPIAVMVATNVGLTGGAPVVAVVHTVVGATAVTAAPYASGNSDGTQVGRYLAEYDMSTDGQGQITRGLGNAGSFPMQTKELSILVYSGGVFRTEDLIGFDANFVTNVGGRLLIGTSTLGEFKF